MVNLIKSMPKYHYTKSDKSLQQKDFVRDLIRHQDLLTILINDLSAYKERVQAYVAEVEASRKIAKKKSGPEFSPISELLDSELFEEGFSHTQNVLSRLKALIFMLETCEGSEQLQQTQLMQLWDILTQNMVLETDQEFFFKFLKAILNEKNWIDTGVICELFETKIQGNYDLLANIQIETFNCIQTMFLIINESQNSLNIVSRPKDESKLSARRQAAQAVSDEAKKIKLEFRVHLPPQQLTGINVIWEMFRQTNRNQDVELQANIIFFLALVH